MCKKFTGLFLMPADMLFAREKHNGQLPATYAEKLEFKNMLLKALKASNAVNPENYEEAAAAVLRSCNPKKAS